MPLPQLPTIDLAVQLGPAAAAQSDPGRLGHVRLCPRDGRAWSTSRGWAASCPRRSPQQPRAGNAPWRTVETPAGMLNSIGLDNDGIEAFIEHHLPYLASARRADHRQHRRPRRTTSSWRWRARLDGLPGVAAIELNISCPNVSRRRRFRHRSGDVRAARRRLPRGVRAADHRQADAERDQHRRRSPRRPRRAGPTRSR